MCFFWFWWFVGGWGGGGGGGGGLPPYSASYGTGFTLLCIILCIFIAYTCVEENLQDCSTTKVAVATMARKYTDSLCVLQFT